MTTLTHEPGEGCGDCPFFGDEFDTCQAVVCGKHPDGRPLLVESSPEVPRPRAPSFCPLRSAPVTVRSLVYEPGAVWPTGYVSDRLMPVVGRSAAAKSTAIRGSLIERCEIPKSDGRYELPDGTVVHVRHASDGSVAVWEEG